MVVGNICGYGNFPNRILTKEVVGSNLAAVPEVTLDYYTQLIVECH